MVRRKTQCLLETLPCQRQIALIMVFHQAKGGIRENQRSGGIIVQRAFQIRLCLGVSFLPHIGYAQA